MARGKYFHELERVFDEPRWDTLGDHRRACGIGRHVHVGEGLPTAAPSFRATSLIDGASGPVRVLALPSCPSGLGDGGGHGGDVAYVGYWNLAVAHRHVESAVALDGRRVRHQELHEKRWLDECVRDARRLEVLCEIVWKY